MTLVRHAKRRAKVRGISREEIVQVVAQGKRLPTYLGREMAMLDGVIAIIDIVAEVVLTVYRATPYQLKEWE